MKVVLLAGGLGTRISEESHLRPKPMIEIGGMPILWHIMKIYSHYGFNDFVICCGYRGHIIKEYFSNYYFQRSNVTFDFSEGNNVTLHSENVEPWRVTLVDTGLYTMTGGRINRIRKYLDEKPFMLSYGDGVSDIDINALLQQHQAQKKILTLSAIQPEGRFGALDIAEDGYTVLDFQEKAKGDGGWVNAGFMVVEPEIFSFLPDDTTVLEQAPLVSLAAQGKLGVYKHPGYWQCMDASRDKTLLEKEWANGHAPWKLWDD